VCIGEAVCWVVSTVGSVIGVLGGGGCVVNGRGSFFVVSTPVLGFQVPVNFNGTQTTGKGKCFSTTNVVVQLDDLQTFRNVSAVYCHGLQ